MNLSDYVLSTLGVYGLPVLFLALCTGSIGVPVPSSLLLLVTGSLVEQGEMSLWPVLGLSTAGAILGDNIGYALGRWGGGPLHRKLGGWIGEKRFKQAEEWLRKRQGAGVFLSRWLLTPLGSVINLICGLTGYSWPRFLLYDVLGEALWVTIYVMLGRFFSDRVLEIGDILGDFSWMIVGLVFVALLGWALFKYLRQPTPKGKTSIKAQTRRVDETSSAGG